MPSMLGRVPRPRQPAVHETVPWVSISQASLGYIVSTL